MAKIVSLPLLLSEQSILQARRLHALAVQGQYHRLLDVWR